ncbi:butyrate kinase [Vagococcus lutrae]|uniref:butyrate kinase n=1 Tax=Vagococcus lutrae TaxID=81947 RepID=UPI00200D68BB|nr:butyrate kinase [Vagococcus lutrae]MDO5741525.1 butyrate kinase [Vagococcus sp.]MCO7150133.1 butyrate kinase [Vagococcus lutrae]MDT2801190.1 butyrate kinase [Vagococcus lutrae]MDT2807503.1 butyrate kinase [Vagococcus lutrae]MDT2818238.1 butyrate kinase [Vagococcus lutrae]
MEQYRIVVINPGSTSTKVSYYENDKEVVNENLFHPTESLEKYARVSDQYDYRLAIILDFLKAHDIDVTKLDAVVGRGGMLPPVDAGAYFVNDEMIEWLTNRADIDHASNLGAVLANGIRNQAKADCIAMIYDPITVDQFWDLSRVSGLKGVKRRSIGHMLNMRSVALQTAEQMNKPYEDLNLIVVHLGSGSSISAHYQGRMVDLILDDEGPFSVERSGGLSLKELIPMCYEMSEEDITVLTRKKGGMISYLNTNSGIEVEERIENGDEEAAYILEAMAYQVAKGIGSAATVLSGKVDGIVITGGLAYSERLTDWVKERVSFIGNVIVSPGENEMYALAMGANRILTGDEVGHTFSLPEA